MIKYNLKNNINNKKNGGSSSQVKTQTNFSHLLYRKHARASPKQVTCINVHSKVGHMPTIII